jgi:hypothetical protein
VLLVLVPVLLFLILLMWGLTGWQTGLEGDAWFFYLNGQRMVSFGTPTRPFLPLANVLGYWLAPGSLAGFNLILAVMLFCRSLLTFVLAHQWKAPLPVSFGAAVLVLLWPSDSGVYYLGALGVYLPGLLALLALTLMNEAIRRPRMVTLFAMWLAIIFSLGGYEANAPLILAAPVFLLIHRSGSPTRFRRFLFRWYVFPVLWIIYYALAVLTQPGVVDYQSSLVAIRPLPELIAAVANVFFRNLLPVWIGDYGNINPLAPVLALFGALFCLSALSYTTHLRTADVDERRSLWLLIVSGLLIVILSVVIFLPTSIIYSSLRTYFVTTAGGMLALTAAIWLLLSPLRMRRSSSAAAVYCVVITILVGIALYGTLQQHSRYAERSEAQQSTVYEFAMRFPAIRPGTQVVVLDVSEGASLVRRMDSTVQFPYAFYVGYGALPMDFPLAVCTPGLITTDPELAAAMQDSCWFSQDQVVISVMSLPKVTSDGSDLLLIAYDGAQFSMVDDPELVTGVNITRYDPEAHFDADASPPENLFTLFGFPPA